MVKRLKDNPKVYCNKDKTYDFNGELESAKRSLKNETVLNHIQGKSDVIKELHKKIIQISSCDVNVLISGESGTGKELVARAIHYLSSRKGNPFIPVNCGAIPENIFENELFGHVKGAFTDARFHQAGLVKEAEGGTLFLDEIGTASPYIQVKFLRLLQNKEYKPLGNSKYCKADIKFIAATNHNLSSLVKNGSFREDLFYRLDVVSVYIPALRERNEDIPLLAERFLDKYSFEHKKPARKLSEKAMKMFVSYSWPGNIRELENKIQQLVVLSASSVIDANELNFSRYESYTNKLAFEKFNQAKRKAIDAFEKTYLVNLLVENKGNIINAAKKAGKSRTSLWNILKKHNISPT